MNLKSALCEFIPKKKTKNTLNLIAASFSTLGALNGLMASTKGVWEAVAVRYPNVSGIIKFMSGEVGMRVFVYVGAITEGVQDLVKANEQYNRGNATAGNEWVVAGFFATTGSIATTEFLIGVAGASSVIPVAGWLVAAVILTGIGIMTVAKAKHGTFNDTQYWLNACYWGWNTALPGAKITAYKTLADEITSFHKLMKTNK
jgi:hypothetical protein